MWGCKAKKHDPSCNEEAVHRYAAIDSDIDLPYTYDTFMSFLWVLSKEVCDVRSGICTQFR
jgi:hypothetical protein